MVYDQNYHNCFTLYRLLIYTCFCAYTMQARSTANGKIRREIQNIQMFKTDPESFSPAIYFSVLRFAHCGVCGVRKSERKI
jgi:hypothetical protein